MIRAVLAVAAVAIGGLAFGQEKKPTAAEEKELQRKRIEAYLKKNPTEVPELLDLAEKADERLTALVASVKVSDDDTPAVRAAKRSLLAENERRKLVRSRIMAGQFAGGAAYLQLADSEVEICHSAALIWSEPEKLLPFAECMAGARLNAELFIAPQVESGIAEPQLAPQLHAARCKAEVVVLKLREQVKKK